jgi:phosphonate transport system substrate-binding protein
VKQWRSSLLFSLFFVALLGALVACGPREDIPYVNLDAQGNVQAVALERAPGRLPLRVAVAAVVSPKVTLDSYRGLLDYLANRLDRPVELLQRPTYAEINELVRSGQADLAFVCGGAYVEAQRDFGMELLVVPQVKGKTVYYSYLIVPTDSTARSLEDLRGKRFAFTDPLSHSGHLVTQYRLLEKGETPETFFAETIFTYSHDNSVRAVASGLVDGASVDSLVYDLLASREPTLAIQTRVIEVSDPYGIPPVVVHPALSSEIKAQLRDALLEMSNDPDGRRALATLHIDRFVPANPENYDRIRQMASIVRGWHE